MKMEEIPINIGSVSIDAAMVVPLLVVFVVCLLLGIGAHRTLATFAIGAIVIGAIMAH